jgi:hypothetical protein
MTVMRREQVRFALFSALSSLLVAGAIAFTASTATFRHIIMWRKSKMSLDFVAIP